MKTELILILLMIGTARTMLKRYVVEEIDRNPGIYYEHLNDVRFTRADWRIIVYVDITRLDFNATGFKNTLQAIRKSCTDFPFLCQAFTQRITYVDNELNKVKEIYENLIDSINEVEPMDPTENQPPQTVHKRSAPLGFIGSLSKSLFGTLSESDGEYLTQQINKLFKGQTKLAQIAYEDTHIVQHTILSMEERLNNTQDAVKKSLITLLDTNDKLDNLINDWQRHNFTREYTAVIAELESALSLYENTYQNLLDTVREARVGHLHPSLITTKGLQQIIRQIADKHPEYDFPIPIEHARCDKLTEIATVKLGFRKGNFLIEATIPMLNKFGYDLYKMHPLPIPQLNQDHKASAFIIPQAPYITLSHDKRTYSFLSEEDLHKCIQTKGNRICVHNQPEYEADEDMACEYLLLNQPSIENLKKCRINYTPKLIYHWIHLSSMDAWLYSFPQPTTIQILCPGEHHELIETKEIGILRMQPRCSARQGHTSLMGTKKLGTSDEFIYLPNLSLTINLIDNKIYEKIRTVREITNLPITNHKFTSTNLESRLTLDDIQDKYEKFIEQQDEKELHSYVSYGSIGTSIIITMIISAILITICVKCSSWKRTITSEITDKIQNSYDCELHPINAITNPTPRSRSNRPSIYSLNNRNSYIADDES